MWPRNFFGAAMDSVNAMVFFILHSVNSPGNHASAPRRSDQCAPRGEGTFPNNIVTNASLAQRQEFPPKKNICRYEFMDASRAANKRRFAIVAKFQKISDVYREQEKKNAQKEKKNAKIRFYKQNTRATMMRSPSHVGTRVSISDRLQQGRAQSTAHFT